VVSPDKTVWDATEEVVLPSTTGQLVSDWTRAVVNSPDTAVMRVRPAGPNQDWVAIA